MPFVSKSQQAKCWATNGFGGKVDCAEWQKDTPKHLPAHVKKKMAKGGPVPKQSDYPDYESFQAAMEQFIQTSPQTPMSTDPGGQPALWHNDQTFEDGLDSQNPTKQIGSQGYGDPLYHDHSAPLKKPQNNAMDPYFMTRGLLNGAQWLSGIRDRNRQNQYMYQQYSALGQNDPVNINDYQPNPFSLYARYGGSLSKYKKMADGGLLDNGDGPGPKTNPPIIVDNKNDPRLRAYNDSLNLYNKEQNWIKSLNADTYNTWKVRANHLGNTQEDYSNLIIPLAQKAHQAGEDYFSYNRISNVPNKPVAKSSKLLTDVGPQSGSDYSSYRKITGAGGFDDGSLWEQTIPSYKKPVQPVIYQPQPQYPLVDKSKYQAQIRGNITTPEQSTYTMQGNNPIYGPANALIGMSDDQGNFYPDSNNTAKRAIVNQADTELLSNPDKLKVYLAQKGINGKIQTVFKKGGWIQKALRGSRKDHPCTGSKFGSSTCPAGSKRYNLAVTFRKMAKK